MESGRIKSGILGGTFDPIHNGHLRAAVEILEEFSLDRIYLIPTFNPPHKNPDSITPFTHRFAMARLAAEDMSEFDVLDIEGARGGFSYTIDTVSELKKRADCGELFLITGMDAFLDIRLWKNYKKLLELINVIIVRRLGYESDIPENLLKDLGALNPVICKSLYGMGNIIKREIFSGMNLYVMSIPQLEISGTEIRKKLEQGQSIRYFLPDRVLSYIKKEGLYAGSA